jgi:uncharacterized sulfatase
MRARAGASTPYELGERSGDAIAKVWSAADRATDREVPIAAAMADLGNSDPAVRYWAAVGCLVRGAPAVSLAGERLVTLLSDAAIGPRIAAAEALGRFGTPAQGEAARDVLVAAADLKAHGLYAAALALNAINHLGNATPALKARIAALPREDDSIDARERDYVPRLVEAILEDRR